MKQHINRIFFFCIVTCFSFANSLGQAHISGKVLTSDGKPAEGVNIELKDLKLFTVTDVDGSFRFRNVKEGAYTVVVTFTGMQTQQLPITVSSTQPVFITLTLKENSRDLDELVI
ncbi:MAG: carboxypeptidase-like regulatory domain-containing protein, partial [Chitinophagaceae bacterium]